LVNALNIFHIKSCIIANGNEGEQGIGAPADAFYSLSIGAVDLNGAVMDELTNR
jgi:hypothetical protein